MSYTFQQISADLFVALQIDLPWHPCLEIRELPEAQLVYNLMTQAWHDSTTGADCLDRREARRWFFSEPFERLCHLTELSPDTIQKQVSHYWRVCHK